MVIIVYLILWILYCSLRVFTFAMVIGVVLLTINYLGSQLEFDFADLPKKSLESFTISNVDDGSKR